MEIIMLLIFIVSASFPFVMAVIADGQIMERTVKVVKANLNRDKQIVPGIVTSDMLALTPRNKDWGPEGKLTQMWEDAFAYWQLKDPAGTLESHRIKQHDWEQKRDELKARVQLDLDLYEVLLGTGRSYGYGNVESAVRAKMRAEDTKEVLQTHEERGLRLTADEKVVAGLAKRYGNEVFYNNDLVYMSAQKNMQTFDYIALTSV